MTSPRLKVIGSKEVDKIASVFWKGLLNNDISSKDKALQMITDLVAKRDDLEIKSKQIYRGMDETFRYAQMAQALKIVIDSLISWTRKTYYK